MRIKMVKFLPTGKVLRRGRDAKGRFLPWTPVEFGENKYNNNMRLCDVAYLSQSGEERRFMVVDDSNRLKTQRVQLLELTIGEYIWVESWAIGNLY